MHTTHGTFKLKSGELFFNPETGIAQGEILVDATTGESGNADRDQRMQNEVLESNRYPAIFYHPPKSRATSSPAQRRRYSPAKAPSISTEPTIRCS